MGDIAIVSGPLTSPLVRSSVNPRYFALQGRDDDKVMYLTGSHVNNNFHDGLGFGAECSDDEDIFDYSAYLGFLKQRGHNFIRLWRWEQFKGHLDGTDIHFCMRPQPWPRIGQGTAKDGKPKFDLSQFNTVYFDRLRERVSAAGNEGFYVSVMLFEGFSLHLTAAPDNIEGHPFHALNNVNAIGITSIVDYQKLPLAPHIQALQEAYIQKVIDTVQDLPNVLYEVANESSGYNADRVTMPDGSIIETPICDSTEWQYWVITFVKQYEQQMGYQAHPVGMTMQYPTADQKEVNTPLFNSPADWISPGFDDVASPMQESRWLTNPPANDGVKVIISDTDHYSPFRSDALWAWKSFLRGHNPVLYDLGIVSGVNPPDPSSGSPSFESLEAARYAMGDTRRFAERVQLSAMKPRDDLSSTGYVLASPGDEYLILQPREIAEPFDVELSVGTYSVEWYGLIGRELQVDDLLTVECATTIRLSAPFVAGGPSVVYLKRVNR